ncbi:MAG: hypothetical protein M3245_05160 [Actinomycetota bacterium]|nr:hypothetical protein [Actinomycetota bacterium]
MSLPFVLRGASVLALAVATVAPLAPRPAAALPRPSKAVRAAEYIVSLQNRHGAIRDSEARFTANSDSQMEYAMWGLAHAYRVTGDRRYLRVMRAGLDWLSARQRRDGSWWFAYAANPPFEPDRRVRGVSATVGLYIYDLWLYGHLSGHKAFVRSKMRHVRRGLRFLYRHMRRARDGTFYSAFTRREDGRYRKDTYRFTSDQADLYLGLRAAARLTGSARYRRHARMLRAALTRPKLFFFPRRGRFAQGIDYLGHRDRTLDVLTVWPNGYVPWVLGSERNTRRALRWMRRHQQPGGGFRLWDADPGYSLSAAVFVMGSHSMGGGRSVAAQRASDWLTTMQDPVPGPGGAGGLADHRKRKQRFCNIAAFAALSWFLARPIIP